jgi:hypothetical protein
MKHCTGKAAFPSMALAAKRARHASRSHEVPMCPYHCTECRQFHYGTGGSGATVKTLNYKRRRRELAEA